MTPTKLSPGLGQHLPPSAVASETPHRRTLLALVCAGIFIIYLDATVVNVALPAMQRELAMSVTGVQWVLNVYVLVFACLLLTAGTLADIVGRKGVFLTGLIGFTIASVVCALAPSSLVLLIGRGLQGACASLVISVSLAISPTCMRQVTPARGPWGYGPDWAGLRSQLDPRSAGCWWNASIGRASSG